MKYLEKHWLSKRQYLAILENAMVIVTVDKDGNPVRWAIFSRDERK